MNRAARVYRIDLWAVEVPTGSGELTIK
jgi:hypothetical protein